MDKEKAKIEYFAIHFTHIIVGLLLLSVGIITVLHFDYGNISFLFAVPHFYLTGLVPTLISFLILFRVFVEAEKISISSDNKTIYLKGRRLRKQNLSIDLSSVQYYGIKYRETRLKRWMIIAILVLFTIEVHWQNAFDLLGYARIAPILLICTILLSIAIIMFVFFPRRFIEIGTNEETTLVPLRIRSEDKLLRLLKILNINAETVKRSKSMKVLYSNIVDGFSSFVIALFLLTFGIVLTIWPGLFFGSFTRTIAIVLGMKLLLRVLNGDPFYFKASDDNLYIGRSLRLTFIKTIDAEVEQQKCFSPLRYHFLEIFCFIYLIFQAIRYSFRNLWYSYMTFSILYFIIGITLIGLIFIRWFNPISINRVQFKEYSINIRDTKPFERSSREALSIKAILSKKVSEYISNLKNLKKDKSLLISLIIFIAFLIWPIIYIVFGGNFIII